MRPAGWLPAEASQGGSYIVGQLPRMADFASWASACEDGLGLDHGEFPKVYEPLRELARAGFRDHGSR